MTLFLVMRTALRATGRNTMRSGLTALGIIVGVAAVIRVVAWYPSPSARARSAFVWRSARARDVLRQFLLEALLLSVIGGAIGAVAAEIIATKFAWPTSISAKAVAIAFGCPGAIGIRFGLSPANARRPVSIS